MSSRILSRTRLEYKQGSSNKFYEVETLDNGTVRLRWGRIGHGALGEMIVGELEADRKIREKLAKGYVIKAGYSLEPLITKVNKTKIEEPNFLKLLRGEK